MNEIEEWWNSLPISVQLPLGVLLGPIAFVLMVCATPVVIVCLMLYGATDAAISTVAGVVRKLGE